MKIVYSRIAIVVPRDCTKAPFVAFSWSNVRQDKLEGFLKELIGEVLPENYFSLSTRFHVPPLNVCQELRVKPYIGRPLESAEVERILTLLSEKLPYRDYVQTATRPEDMYRVWYEVIVVAESFFRTNQGDLHLFDQHEYTMEERTRLSLKLRTG